MHVVMLRHLSSNKRHDTTIVKKNSKAIRFCKYCIKCQLVGFCFTKPSEFCIILGVCITMSSNEHLTQLINIGLKGDKVAFARQASKLARAYEASGLLDLAASIRSSIQDKDTFKLQKASSSFLNHSFERLDSLPTDQETKFDLADITQPKEKYQKPFLQEKTFNKIEEFVLFNENSTTLKEAGLGVTSSIILYGPPGCGKTLAAHHISYRLNLPLITARCDSLVSSYLGSTSKNIRQLFEYASKKPCILFLDELDALAKARDDQHELGELKRVVVSLLQNIDSLPDHTILVAASNHEGLLDSAIWRRFEYRIPVGLPDFSVRESLFNRHSEIKDSYLDFAKDLSAMSEGMSCAFITQCCLRSIRHALVYGQKKLDTRFLIESIFESLDASFYTEEEKTAHIVNKLREIDNKRFTIRKIAKILGLSTAKVSRLTKT